MKYGRRRFIKAMVIGTGAVCFVPEVIWAKDNCNVQHPFMPADSSFKEECHNCGMRRSMWARTWHTYKKDGQTLHTCSMHCLAEATTNAGIQPAGVMAALYLAPQTMTAAENAYYVAGSNARGTMTKQSKLAFAAEEEAKRFSSECGGKVARFDNVYAAATESISKENTMISKKRMQKGKIVEPVDNKDVCPVCGMYAARYPRNKCQLTLQDGSVVHFCATQCLFAYLENPAKYSKNEVQQNLIWVIDYESGEWIYAPNAFYLLGTQEVGPMGMEALPFINRQRAEKFLKAEKGEILTFNLVTVKKILSL